MTRGTGNRGNSRISRYHSIGYSSQLGRIAGECVPFAGNRVRNGTQSYDLRMNAAHMEFCASPEWREMIETLVMPDALRHNDLGQDVVEIGPGPGFTTDVLRGLTGHLTAVEVDPGLAASLKQRLVGTNVTVVLGDAVALDFPDRRFTGAASFHMLHHVPTADDQNRVFAELSRVLKAGGLLVAADGVASEGSRSFHEGDIYNPIDPEHLDQRLGAVGFVSISVQLHDLGWFCQRDRIGVVRNRSAERRHVLFCSGSPL